MEGVLSTHENAKEAKKRMKEYKGKIGKDSLVRNRYRENACSYVKDSFKITEYLSHHYLDKSHFA